MRYLVLVTVLLISSASHSGSVLIRNVTIHTMLDGGIVERTDVLIGEKTISGIGAVSDVPSGIEIVDGTGLHMTPGLFTAVTQLGLDEIDLEASTVDSMLADTFIGPAFDVQYAFNPRSVVARVNLVEGVTHGVIAPRVGPDMLAGFGAVADYGNGELIARRIAMFGALGANSAEKLGGSRAESIGKLRRALSALPGFKPRGFVPNLGEYSRQEMLALKEVVRDKKPLVMQVHRAADIRQLLKLASDFDLKLVVRGASEAWQVADELAQAEVAVILDPLENLPLSFERLGARLDNAALLHRAGVQVAIVVSDFHNTRLLRQHAGNAVAYGLPWEIGMRAITRTPAEIFGVDDVGLLQADGAATFVLWNGDPLEVTSYPTRIMIDGEWLDLTSRQTQLFERYRQLEGVDHKYR